MMPQLSSVYVSGPNKVCGPSFRDYLINPIFGYLKVLFESTLSQVFSECRSSIPILVFMAFRNPDLDLAHEI